VRKLLAASLCVLGVTLGAQQAPTQETTQATPTQQGPTFRTGVDVIAVDVSVVDGRGRPVDGLLIPDFSVKIDGSLRRVVSAEQVRIDVDAARKQATNPFETFYTTNLAAPNGRLILIAVDQSGIRTGMARAILDSASKFLDLLSPADRVAFLAYPQPGAWVDFTNDRIRLREAMKRIVGSQNRYLGKFNIGLYEAIAITDKLDQRIFNEVVGRECRRANAAALEICERDVIIETAAMVRTVRQDTAESLRGLQAALARLAEIEGPKTLLLMSEGIVLESPNELDDVIRQAALSRVTVNVLLMDVPRDDITVGVQRPTISEDRELQVSGLRNLAQGARGSLYNVFGTGESIFERLASETSAYYLLGVEQTPGDRDGAQHRIDVEVLRRDVTVRSRRAFVLSAASGGARKPEDNLLDALRSPFGVTEIPLRITTFTRQDTTDTTKVRVMLAADVGQPGAASEEFTIGYALLDNTGRVVSSASERRTLAPPNGSSTAAADYLREIVVEPGVYSLRFGVVDSSGRRGGVVREVAAWKLAGEEFALGDLMIGEVGGSAGDQRLRPGVEPHVRATVGAFMDLYATSPAAFDDATVMFEIAADADAPALLSNTALLVVGAQPTWRTAQTVMSPDLLPPGRYVARARVLRDGKTAGVLTRPFLLERPGAPTTAVAGEPAPALPPAPGLVIGGVSAFDPASVLAGDTLAGMLDLVEKRAPALKDAMVAARAGRYSSAAVEALTAGDQDVAAFLKGLEWYTKGELDQAATQLQIAAGPRRDFFPAAFYLGASFAAAGRDRDAAAVWQMAIGAEARPLLAYLLFADARFRDGQPDSVIDVLAPAHRRDPANDEISKRLAMAYLMTAKYVEALPVLHEYLARRATDQEALFAAVFAQYQLASREGIRPSVADEATIAGYVRAYRGPSQELLQKYLEVIRAR
jgi:VWFA-related protein